MDTTWYKWLLTNVFPVALAVDHLHGEVGKARIAARKRLDLARCRRCRRRCRQQSCREVMGCLGLTSGPPVGTAMEHEDFNLALN
jgi:hypothetical protein